MKKMNTGKCLKKLACCLLSLPLAVSVSPAAFAGESFSPALDPGLEGSLNIAGHYSNFEALEEEFNLFSEYYPDVDLTYTCLDNYNRVIATALGASEAPDIYFTFPWMMDSDDYQSLFDTAEDLSDPALGIDLSCIREGLLNEDRNGCISMIPVYTTTYGMLVNEAIFEKEGLSVPKTYQELLDVCDALKNAGYESPVMGYNQNNSLLYSLFFPHFCAGILGNKAAVEELNALAPTAGEYMRSSLELTADFMSRGYVDLEACNLLENDYNAVILRFFEGDIPMMMASGNTVSGTEKRESQSEAFLANPFEYSFHPVPSTEEGGYFLNTISLGFSVNKNSGNLELANEFLRFLACTEELNRMAESKRMVTPCRDMELDDVYASFGEMDTGRVIYSYVLGLADAPDVQVRRAGFQVTIGAMTVDEAVAAFGTFE